MSAKRERRELANFLASHKIYVDAELPVETADGLVIQLWPRSTTTITDIEGRGVAALRTAFAMPYSREVEIIGDGSVAVHLSHLPAPESVAVDRIAPWRDPRISVVDAEGNAARLPQEQVYGPLRRVTHSSGTAYLSLMQDARLTSAISYTEGRGTVTEHQVPLLRRIVMTRTGATMVLGMGTLTAEAWEKATPIFRSHLRAPRLVIRPRVGDGEVDVELRAVETQWPRAVALPLDTLAAYPGTRVPLGVDELGEVVWWEPRVQPHLLAVGSTGGGKSVALRGLISAVLAAPTTDPVQAWSVMLADGKGSDYSSLAGVPGVRAVTAEVPMHVWLVAAARRELDRRRSVAARDKAAGVSDPYAQFPPLLVLLDEWADVSAQIAARYGKKGLEAVQADVSSILRVGREARVHLVIATQELRVEAVPGSWQENLKTVVSLGRPSQQTLRVAFPGDELREAAGEIAATIPQSAKGRAMVVDADTGDARAFQSFWQFSPGTTDLADAPDATIREAWAATAQCLGTRPRTAPRVAPELDGPEFRELDVPELRDLAPVLLDLPTGPDPDAARFDPASPGWLGAAPLDAGSGMDWGTGDTPPAPEPALTNDPAPMTEGPTTAPEPSAEGLGQLVVQMRCAPDDLAASALSSILLDPRLRALAARELTALLRDDVDDVDPEPALDTPDDDITDLLKGL
ncbi:MAG: hypothetical protein KC933_32850 [Myxococcales bacterium]|nr:hypothetical protein [Myxococcales bacterium]